MRISNQWLLSAMMLSLCSGVAITAEAVSPRLPVTKALALQIALPGTPCRTRANCNQWRRGDSGCCS
jgi:hypothetical protein